MEAQSKQPRDWPNVTESSSKIPKIMAIMQQAKFRCGAALGPCQSGAMLVGGIERCCAHCPDAGHNRAAIMSIMREQMAAGIVCARTR